MSKYDLYVINLNRSTQRLKDFQESFKNYNVKRISAFDGIKLHSYDNIKLPSTLKMPIPIYNYSNYKYYYACSLSHIQAIYEAYKLNKDSIIICEDDMCNPFQDKWNNTIDNIIDNRPKDCECLTLFCVNEIITKKMINFEENYVPLIFNKEGDRNNWHTGSSFYFLDNNGIKKIIEKYIKNNKIDFSFTNNLLISDYNLIFPLLNTYHYTKPLFIDNYYKSTINNNFHEKKLENKKIIINYFNNI